MPGFRMAWTLLREYRRKYFKNPLKKARPEFRSEVLSRLGVTGEGTIPPIYQRLSKELELELELDLEVADALLLTLVSITGSLLPQLKYGSCYPLPLAAQFEALFMISTIYQQFLVGR